MTGPESIYNWRRLDRRITTSGQPTEAQLAEIRALGIRNIINLGLHTHEKALPDEAASVAALGMNYIHIPVDFQNPTEDDFGQFCIALEATKRGPVHVHCIANYRVSAFFYRYRREFLGWNEEKARTDIEALWYPTAGSVWAAFMAQRISGTEGGDIEQRVVQMDSDIKANVKKRRAAKLVNDVPEMERADVVIVRNELAIFAALKAEEKKLNALLKIGKITDDEQKVAQLLRALQLTSQLTRIWEDRMGEPRHAARVQRLAYSIAPALDAIGTGRRAALIPFLDSDDKDLCVMAAGGLIEVVPERAIPLLKKLVYTERFLNAGWTALFFIQSQIDKDFTLQWPNPKISV